MSRAKVQGWSEEGGSTITVNDTTYTYQESFISCTVTVYLAGTVTIAAIYGDNIGTVKANPFTASATGYWFFYADAGRYDVRFSGGTITTPFTLGDFIVFDEDDLWVNVKAAPYNAAGDGITDDTTAFQAALTAAAGSKPVLIPIGTYIVGPLTVPSNTRIIGMGWSTIVRLKAASAASLFGADGISNFEISNLKLDGNKANVTLGGPIWFTNAIGASGTNLRIHDCWIINSKGAQIGFLGDYSNVWIYNNRLEWTAAPSSSNPGINIEWSNNADLTYPSNVWVLDNHFINHYWGAYVGGGKNIHICNNTFTNGSYDDVTLYVGDGTALGVTPLLNVEVIGNISESGKYFVRCDGYAYTYGGMSTIKDLIISNNQITGSSEKAIWAFNGAAPVITNNIIRDCGDTAIKLEKVETGGEIYHAKVDGNQIFAPTSHGIHLVAYVSDSTISNNVIYDAGGRGISIDSFCDENVVSGNVIRDSTGDGIHLEDHNINNIIGPNVVDNATAAAINITNSSTKWTKIIAPVQTVSSSWIFTDSGTETMVDGVLDYTFVGSATIGFPAEQTIKTHGVYQNFHLGHKGIRLKATGSKVGVVGRKYLKLYWGAYVATTHVPDNNTNDWSLLVEIYFTAPATQVIYWEGYDGNTRLAGVAAGAQNMAAGNIDLSVAGECEGNGDTIILKTWDIRAF